MASIVGSEQQVAASVVKWLQNNGGMTLEGACGVAGNIKGESSFNPKAIGDHGTSAGICQWHNERWDNLKKFASARGLSWNTLEVQLSFLMSELNSKSYKSLLEICKTTNDVVKSSNQWGHDFERFSGYTNYNTPTYAKRASYAKAIYEGITNGNWEATDIENVGGSEGGINASRGITGGIVQNNRQNEPRPIMASRGQNTVYKLSSANTTNKPVNVGRKNKFTSMQESFSNGAPELGRDIVLSDGMLGSEILKGQNAKTFRGNKKESN